MTNIRCAIVTVFALCLGWAPGAQSLEPGDGNGCVRMRRVAGGLVVVPVEIEGHVYPFLLDTGSEPTLVDPALAAELGLRLTARTALVTTTGLVDAHEATASLVFSGVRAKDISLVLTPLDAIRAVDRSIRGVLGQDVFRRSNWLLDYRHGVLRSDPQGSMAEGLRGERLPVRWSHGRPTVPAIFGRTGTDLVLDSAATSLVLFSRSSGDAAGRPMRLRMLDGFEMDVPTATADALRIGSTVIPRPVAAIVPRQDAETSEGGLLPTSLFDAVYFDNLRGEVTVLTSAP